MHFSTTVLAITLASAFNFVEAAPASFGAVVTRDVQETRSFLTDLAERAVSTLLTLLSDHTNPTKQTTETVYSDTGSVSVTPEYATTTVSLDATVGDGADVADAVGTVITKVVDYVQGLIDGDIARRQKFTQRVVAEVRAQFPGYNVVMSNVGYSFTGTTISKSSTSYNAKVGSNVSYDVLTFTSGTFTLEGDGGFENVSFPYGF